MASIENGNHDFPLYNWGAYENFSTPTILDTTLRDGIQSPLERYPSIEEKLQLIDLLLELGIEAFDIGFPVSNGKHKQHTARIAKYLSGRKPHPRLTCLARSTIEDVKAIVEISQSAGVPIEVLLFVGSSPARLLVEEWNVDQLKEWATTAIDFAIREGLEVNFACEDVTRSEPETVSALYLNALEYGASRITLPDTVGICNPIGATQIVRFVRDNVIKRRAIGLDWHGHNDRGLAVANALAALAAGADCIHTTIFGIGERCGNIPLEPTLANIYYLCGKRYRFEVLPRLSQYAASIFGESVHSRHPVIGRNAYSTAAGIHASAIFKALQIGKPEIIANVYAGVDARLSGFKTSVEIGPLSGVANVEWKLAQLGFPFSQDIADRILNTARNSDRIFTDEEIITIVVSSIEEKPTDVIAP